MVKQWLRAATIRAIKTAAQAALGVIGASAVLSEVDFAIVVSAAILAALVSYLTSLAGLPEVDHGASLAQIEGTD